MIDVAAVEADLASLTKAERALNATFLTRTAVDVAATLGWRWCHWRAAPRPNGRGWAVPVEGPLGTGWPDLFLIQPAAGRAIVLEVKAWADYQRNGLSAAQLEVLDLLERAGIRAYVLTAADVRDPLEGCRLVEILTR